MTFLAALLGNEKLARVVGYVLLGLLLVGALLIGKCAYDSNVIKDHEAERAAKMAPTLRDADEEMVTIVTGNDAQISRDEKDQRDAVQSKPVEPLTARQRARACSILVRQAREAGTRPPAACVSEGGAAAEAKR